MNQTDEKEKKIPREKAFQNCTKRKEKINKLNR